MENEFAIDSRFHSSVEIKENATKVSKPLFYKYIMPNKKTAFKMLNGVNSMKVLSSKIPLRQKVEVLEEELILKAIEAKNSEISRIANKLDGPEHILF